MDHVVCPWGKSSLQPKLDDIGENLNDLGLAFSFERHERKALKDAAVDLLPGSRWDDPILQRVRQQPSLQRPVPPISPLSKPSFRIIIHIFLPRLPLNPPQRPGIEQIGVDAGQPPEGSGSHFELKQAGTLRCDPGTESGAFVIVKIRGHR